MLRGVLSSASVRLALCFRLCLCAALLAAATPLRAADDAEMRAFWMPRASLDSADGVRRAIAAAVAGGFTTVFVPVSLSSAFPTGFDGVADAIREASSRSLRVHAWLDVNRAAGADELPGARDHVLYQHPEWLMVPRDLAVALMNVDTRSPEYLGRLARWTRGHLDQADALFLSPLDPGVTPYLNERVSALLARYAVQGVHLDTVRFPGTGFDYSRRALDVFRTEVRAGLTAAERLRMDAVEAIDPFAYPEEFPEQWNQFRQARLTALVTTLAATVRAARPDVRISAGITPDADRALREHLQDWRTWIEHRYVDALLDSPPPALPARPGSAAAGSH